MEEENAYPKKSVRRSFTTCGTLFGLFPALLLLAFPVVGPILFFLVLIFVFLLAWLAGAFIASLKLYRSWGSYFTVMTTCAFLGLSCLFPLSILGAIIGGPMFGSFEEAACIILPIMGIGAFSGLMTAMITLPSKEDSENGSSS